MPWDYEGIKNFAREYKVSVNDLLALSSTNDPFYVGREGALQQAEWFAELFKEHESAGKVHLRRLHYRFAHGEETVYRHTGELYKNNNRDWNYLQISATYARHLGIVPRDAFVDRRNPDPVLNKNDYEAVAPGWEAQFEEWSSPEIDTEICIPEWEPPQLSLRGYAYYPGMQPYLLEVWAEKTTQNDILKPLCEEYHANFISGAGFLSITAVTEMLYRRAQLRKPYRILYLSDHDPGGVVMPMAVARQVEHQLRTEGYDPDLKLDALAVTPAQIEEYELPSKPIDDSDHRKESFEERYGEGHVELDALEALKPGSIEKILRERLDELTDKKMERKVRSALWEARDVLNRAEEEIMAPYEEKVEEKRKEVSGIVARYQTKVIELNAQMQAELEDLMNEVTEMYEEVLANVVNLVLEEELPSLPEPETPPDTHEWLFDGTREHLAQLDYYRCYKGLPSLEKLVEQKRAEHTRQCTWCDEPVEVRLVRGDVVYCSKSCKNKAYRQRRRQAG